MKITDNKKAESIYKRAERKGVYLEADCSQVTPRQWEQIMNSATRADKKRIDKILIEAGEIDAKEAKFNNPYNYYKTDKYIIRRHSATEYFYRINE
jgi:hypothetical protein